MNIHEYHAKALLHAYGVPVAEGKVAFSHDEAASHAKDLGEKLWVVKAQIHAGGRGKGGGVKLVKSIEELRAEAERMLGKPLITPQTGPKGRVVRRIFVERATGRIAFVASSEGGIDIEHVAATTPEKILALDVDPATGLSAFHARIINAAFGLSGDQAKQCAKLL